VLCFWFNAVKLYWKGVENRSIVKHRRSVSLHLAVTKPYCVPSRTLSTQTEFVFQPPNFPHTTQPPYPALHLSLCAPQPSPKGRGSRCIKRHAAALLQPCMHPPSVANRATLGECSAAAAACGGTRVGHVVRCDAHRPAICVYKSFASQIVGSVVSASTYVRFHTLFRVLFVPCHFASFFLSTSPVSPIFICLLITSRFNCSNQYVHRSLDVEGELSAPRAAPRCLQRHLALLEL